MEVPAHIEKGPRRSQEDSAARAEMQRRRVKNSAVPSEITVLCDGPANGQK
jgi:hypothetical protein